MPELSSMLVHEPGVQWIVGQIKTITGGVVTVTYGDGMINSVGYLDSYVPVVGDTVHMLSQDGVGCLILGSNNYVAPPPYPPQATASPVTVTASQWATYGPVANTWTGGVVNQSPTAYGCWFFAAGAFTALAGLQPAKFEIEINLLTGGPPEFVAHRNSSPTGALVLASTGRHAPMTVTAGVPTWVPLPLDWATGMTNGEVSGIGIGGGIYSGSYSGSGTRLRFTPL
jgi:hypothetical protein